MIFSRSMLVRRSDLIEMGASEVVLDLSRLLGRAYHTTPTGIDRVEFVYARELLARIPDRLRFAAVHPAGGYYGRLSTAAVRQFLSFTDARWHSRDVLPMKTVRSAAMRHLLALRPRPTPVPAGPRVYLQASPHHLENRALVAAILKSERAKLVTLVHDIIPLTHPEYARENGRVEHRERMRTIDALASGVIGNSQATIDAIRTRVNGGGADRILRVAHLGTEMDDALAVTAPLDDAGPYFVCVATIEPRKNHLLLLNVWRRLVETMGAGAPRLVLVGRRGWENENAIDMIERCRALGAHVIEESNMSDRQMAALLAGARALLLPSFAEGFGMPVAEALAAEVPVICSDIAALREVGRDVPDYLDPIDGTGWLNAIADYSTPDSAMRAAQVGRMRGWVPTLWSHHFDIVMEVVDRVATMAG